MRFFRAVVAACLIMATAELSAAARAETAAVTIAYQYGLAYLPLMVMREQKLLEQQAKAAGLGDVEVTYATMSGPGLINDGLISGTVQFGAVGPPSLVTLWAKTKGRLGVKAAGGLAAMPMYLNTIDPAVKTLADFTEKDKIAVPTAKVSVQAVTLQMAAAKAFGRDKWDALDRFTVSMAHPDAMAALLSGRSEVNSHFTLPPFTYQELADPRVHRVLSSYEVLGGPSTNVLMVTTTPFHDANPKTYDAFVAALDQAMAWIAANKEAAADLYLKSTGSKEKREAVLTQLSDPEIQFTTTPKNIGRYADFMADVGSVKDRPASWKDLAFPNLHSLPGS